MSFLKHMRVYKEVTKEEYDSFITNYEKQHELKGHFYMDWYDIYDFEVSETEPITRSSPDDKYYILKEML